MRARSRPVGWWRWLIAVTIGVVAGACEPESLRPSNYSRVGIELSELSVLPNPGHPTNFRPRDDLPAWDASLPINWADDPFHDRNWQFRLHSWHSMDYGLKEYSETGDIKWLRSATDVALDWWHFHVELGNRSAFEWHDHAAGVRASRLAYLLDNVLDGRFEIAESELEALMRLGDIHAEKLREPDFLSHGNHGIFQLVGLDALCRVIHWRRSCEDGRVFAASAFRDLLRTQFTSEGVHTENSPAYQLWVLRALDRARAEERFSAPEILGIMNLARTVVPWLTWPNGEFVAFGDSSGAGPILDSVSDATCFADDSCWATRDLTRSGYAIIRSVPEVPIAEASMLFIKGKGYRTGHKHADELAFSLMEDGRKIFVDSGQYGYNRDDARRYVVSARAHNVPSLADREITPQHVDVDAGRFGPIRIDGSEFVVDGLVERRRKYRGRFFRHERTFHYAPGVSLTIKDRLINRTNSPWLSNLHLAPDLVPIVERSSFSVQVGDRLVRAEFRGEGCTLGVAKGETDPYQGWVSPSYLQLAPAPVVSATCPADLVDSEWRIDLDAT